MESFNKVLDFVYMMTKINYSNYISETKDGISQKEYDDYRIGHSLRTQSVKLISKTESSYIYYDEYWLANECDELETKIAYCVFDTAIVHASEVALKFLKLTTNPEKYLDARRVFVNSLIAKNPSSEILSNGWINRISKLEDFLSTIND